MRDFIESFHLLTPQEIDWLENAGRYKTIRKGEFFIQAGQTSREVAFVESGMLRSFYHNSKDEEITYCFTFSNAFIAAYSSFITQQPTFEYIQALTDVQLFVITREDLLRFEQQSVNWLRLSKMIAEQEFIRQEQRILHLLREDAEHRYRELLLHQQEYLQHIPLHHLASYLGITQRHLSRIRRTVSI